VLRLDPAGKLLWQQFLGGKKTDNAWALINQDFHHYILVLPTSFFGSGSTDAWIVCFDKFADYPKCLSEG
jgi:hypothetical protein